jgi:hypothetical protein
MPRRTQSPRWSSQNADYRNLNSPEKPDISPGRPLPAAPAVAAVSKLTLPQPTRPHVKALALHIIKSELILIFQAGVLGVGP